MSDLTDFLLNNILPSLRLDIGNYLQFFPSGLLSLILPSLRYDRWDLKDFISQEITTLHHDAHHQTYLNGLIATLKKLHDGKVTKIPPADESALRFNLGGHLNHTFFWLILAPNFKLTAPPPPDDPKTPRTIPWDEVDDVGGRVDEAPKLTEAVNKDFGVGWFDKPGKTGEPDVPGFQTLFNGITAAVQGSGWGWLAFNRATGKLEIKTTSNQEILQGYDPIIGVDVWEHAYYLQYKNKRADYLKAIWNVINFKQAELNYNHATAPRNP